MAVEDGRRRTDRRALIFPCKEFSSDLLYCPRYSIRSAARRCGMEHTSA